MRIFTTLPLFVLLFVQTALGQTYKLTVSGTAWTPDINNSVHIGCSNFIQMFLHFSDNTVSDEIILIDLSRPEINNGEHCSFSYNSTLTKTIKSIDLNGARAYNSRCIHRITLHPEIIKFGVPSSCCWVKDYYAGDNMVDPSWSTELHFKITPQVSKGNANEGTIYTTDNVRASVTGACSAESYEWYYMVGNDSWTKLPGASGSSIDVPVSSITSQSNVMLYVRASLCNLEPIFFTYTVKQSPPGVAGISDTSPLCHGEGGSVSIQFDRTLESQESLTLFYNPGTDPATAKSSALSPDANNLAVVDGISPGTYNYEIKYLYDGVQSGNAGTGTFTINDVSPVIASVQPPPDYCDPSATIRLTASGGTGNYTYVMTNTHCVGDACKSSGSFNGSITLPNLGSGHYQLEIKDTNGCLCNPDTDNPGTLEFDVVFALTANIQASTIKCSSDPVVLTAMASGGKPGVPKPYKYEWFNLDGNSIGSAETLNNVAPGNYKVKVTDGNGQTKEASYQATVPEPVDLQSSSVTGILCNGYSTGAISIEPTGGSGSYKYSWSGPYGFTSANKDLTDLVAGTYQLTLTDLNGCRAKETPYTFNVDQPLNGFNLGGIYAITTDGPGRTGGEFGLTINGGTPFDTGYIINLSTPRGASPNEQKNWSNGVCTYQLTNLIEGAYSVTFTDRNGCLEYYPFFVAAPPPVQVNSSVQPVSCNGSNDGSIVASASGGKPDSGNLYKFRWLKNGELFREDNFLSASSALNNLSSGTYLVIAEDSKGNVVTSNATIIVEPPVLSLNTTVADVLCFGKASGKITLDIQGGTPPYRYVWASGQSSRDLVSVVAGDYSVDVIDSHGCTVSWSGTIHQPASEVGQNVVLVEHPLKIRGDGKLEVSIVGGIPPYSYQWLNSSGTEILSGTGSSTTLQGVKAGNYTLSVNDANGCNLPITYTLTDPPVLIVDLFQEQIISCFGNNDGQLKIVASGGVIASVNRYIYEWYQFISATDSVLLEKSTISEALQNLAPGTYFGWVEDKGGTRVRTKNLTIVEPEELKMLATAMSANCFGGADGVIRTTTTGGTPPYQVKWVSGENIGQQTQANPGDDQITGLLSGAYAVEITDSHQCAYTINVTVRQPASPISITTQKVRGPTGAGLSTGLIQAQISGGTPDYWFQLKNGSGLVVGEERGSTIDVANLPQGTYTLTVRDNNYNSAIGASQAGCFVVETYVLTDPEPLEVSIVQTQSITCFGDATAQLQATATGGIQLDDGGYYYSWYKVSVPGDSLKLSDSGVLANNLEAGRYVLKVVDMFSNKAYSNVLDVSQPALLEVAALSEAARCFGGADGQITLTVSGGTYPYSCVFESVGFQRNYNIGSTGKIDFQQLSTGTYILTVSDANLCPRQLVVDVGQPDADLGIDFPVVEPPSGAGLKNGSIKAQITGGTAPYQYVWTDSDNKVLHSGTGSQTEISGLGDGFYLLSVTDANYNSSEATVNKSGCMAMLSYFLTEPKPLVVSLEETASVLCYGDSKGELTATVTGGVQIVRLGYIYQWYKKLSATDSLLITDRGSPLQKGLNSGTYFLWVTDKNNNRTRSSDIVITEPELLRLNYNFGDVTCFGGSNGYIRTQVYGGTPPYSYNWSSGDHTPNLDNITTGNYSLNVTDQNGCAVGLNQSIISPLAPVTIRAKVVHPTEFMTANGRIMIESSGGAPPYTYSWVKTDGSKVETDALGNAINLGDGFYTLRLTDSNFRADGSAADNQGCLQEYTYHIIEPPLLVVRVTVTSPVVCKGEAQGSLQSSVSGGIPFTGGGYQYKWFRITDHEKSALTGSGPKISNLVAGTYRVEVTDSNQVKKEATFILDEPDLLTLDLKKSDTSVNGLEAFVSGGKPPYRFLWSSGQHTKQINDIADGGYFVWVTDALGCDIYKGTSVGNTVYDPAVPVIALLPVNPDCPDACNGSATATLTGGTPPYSLDWGSGPTSNTTASSLCAGTYRLTVTDAKQKTASQVFALKDPERLVIPIEKQVSFCQGQVFKADATVPLAGATYSWVADNGFSASGPVLEIEKGGQYTVTVTSPTGCKTSANMVVTENVDPGVYLDYVVASQAMATQEIVLVNTTSGSAGAMEWILPPEAKVNEMTPSIAKIIIEKPGNYPIGLKTNVDGCTLEKVKNLTITPYSSETAAENGGGLRIVDVSVFPNPSNGQFTVKVELSQASAISMYLIHSASYSMAWSKTMSGSNLYETSVGLVNPNPGVYFLLVETSGGSTTRKIIVL